MQDGMLGIGEFSRATALTIKQLRHYHDRGLLVPSDVDPRTGYRYYDEGALERARIIKTLRELEFPLDDIQALLDSCEDDADVVSFFEARRDAVVARMHELRSVAASLDNLIEREKRARTMTDSKQIEDRTIDPQLIAGIRMRGRFEQCQDAFKRLGKAIGFGAAGKPGMLIYDEAYKPDDADFEPYFPVARDKPMPDGISLRELAGGRALCLIHEGPYDRINAAYARLFAEAARRQLDAVAPSREVYIKGPGMLFRGNPERYLTEVQLFVRAGREPPERVTP